MLILGIDPNTFSSGYALLDTETNHWNSGTIKLKKSQWEDRSLAERSVEQRNQLQIVIGDRKIDYIVIENVYLGPRANVGMELAFISGVLIGGLSNNIEQIAYLTWCKNALGKGIKNESLAVNIAGKAIGRILTVEKNIDEACAICLVLATMNNIQVKS